MLLTLEAPHAKIKKPLDTLVPVLHFSVAILPGLPGR
jgi:hypothetical protein